MADRRPIRIGFAQTPRSSIYLPYANLIPCSEKLNWIVFARANTLADMNEHAGIARHSPMILAGRAPMAGRAHIEVVRAWESPPKRLSMKDSFRAGAFLIFYLVAYLAAGFVGVTFMEWAWMRIFG
jgi:hypothetical protein